MLRSSLCDYIDAYIVLKGTITAINTAAQVQPNNGTNTKVIFKNCAPFTNWINRKNNTQVDDAHDIDVIMSMYSYGDNYSKPSGILWQCSRDEPAVANNNKIDDFTEANSITYYFKIKEKITGRASSNGRKNVEIMIPLKYLSNFSRTL